MRHPSFANIAHRGASAYAPENTIAAFDKAVDLGAGHVEFDVHFTADGHAGRPNPPVSPFNKGGLRGIYSWVGSVSCSRISRCDL